MRITDFSVKKQIAKREEAGAALGILVASGLSTLVLSGLVATYECATEETSRAFARARRIKLMTFNLNAWSDEASLADFRFLRSHVGYLSKILKLPEAGFVTKRCGYKASPVEATAILLRRLASSTRWS